MWLVITVIAVTAILIYPARRRDDRHAAGPGTLDEVRGVQTQASRAAERIDRISLELESLHREVAARTDNKLRMLEELIRQADKRIERLAGEQRDMGPPDPE